MSKELLFFDENKKEEVYDMVCHVNDELTEVATEIKRLACLTLTAENEADIAGVLKELSSVDLQLLDIYTYMAKHLDA